MRRDATILISLGFSGQTRLVIDQFGGPGPRMPFDDGVLTRAAVIDALKSDGQSLRNFAGEPQVPPAPHSSAQSDDDRDACWQRFAETARSGARKTFVLSNAEHGLKDLADDDTGFDRSFGLGRGTFAELTGALDAFGARNYSLTFLSRSLCEIEDTASLRDPRLDHRFVGTLSLRPHIRVAAGMFGAFAEPCLSGACGAYDRSRRLVKAINSDVAIIYDMSAGKALPCGSLTRLNGGFAAFFEGRDQCLTAISAEHGLYFSNGARWSKDLAATTADVRSDS